MWFSISSGYVRLTMRIFIPAYLPASILDLVRTAQLLPPPLAQAPPYPMCFLLALKNSICFWFGLGITCAVIGITPFLIGESEAFSLSALAFEYISDMSAAYLSFCIRYG